jgi:glycine dehydrogenase
MGPGYLAVSTVPFSRSLDSLIEATVPRAIVRHDGMNLGKYHEGMTESQFLAYFK